MAEGCKGMMYFDTAAMGGDGMPVLPQGRSRRSGIESDLLRHGRILGWVSIQPYYLEHIGYDGNGNIQTHGRNGHKDDYLMDVLTYTYETSMIEKYKIPQKLNSKLNILTVKKWENHRR